jgi:hypothetical protein
MGRGFMADRIRGRSQSCRRIGLIGLCIFHTIEVPYNQCRDHRGSTTSRAENYQSVTGARRVVVRSEVSVKSCSLQEITDVS